MENGSFRRLQINLSKISGIGIMLFLTIHLHEKIPEIPTIRLVLILALLSTMLVTFIDMYLESLDIPGMIAAVLSIFSMIFLGIDMTIGYSSDWVHGAPPEFFMVLLFIFHIVLSLNDMEMEGFASRYFYRREERRHGRFIVHLAFNLIPVLIGAFGIHHAVVRHDIDGAIMFATSVVGGLLLFAVVDEILRHVKFWSFFWVNRQVTMEDGTVT